MRFAILIFASLILASDLPADEWKSDPTWHDGLVEKAIYTASRVVYGKPRAYEMIVFTNKEQHDTKTLTKADKSADTVEVFKHNHIEVIPTPNYDYKYETTTHLTVDDLSLTRLDCSSQEFCGTSFKQVMRLDPKTWDYWSFSYMPEAGRHAATIEQREDAPMIPEDALPLWLRDHDFAAASPLKFQLLPTRKNNRPTASAPVEAEIHNAGEEDDSYKIELRIKGEVAGTYWMAKDRLHVMTKYQSADGQQSYELKDLSRVNYWTIQGE